MARSDAHPTTLTRAEVLKAAAVGGAALTAPGLLATRAEAANPKRGGTLRVGLTGAGSGESVDAQKAFSNIDQARLRNLYGRLVTTNNRFGLSNELAEEITPNKNGAQWTVRLIDGAEFHNGKTIGADDLMFTVRRIFKLKAPPAATMAQNFGPGSMKKLDRRTVRFTLKTPTAFFSQPFAASEAGLVPVGYNPKKPVGSGPFVFESFSPGQESVFNRFANYFGRGPFVDELVIISFADDTSRLNALLSKQVDAIETVPYAQVKVVEKTPGLETYVIKSGANLVFTMRVDTPPFDDARVRQAMRLAVDRRQMIAQAINGYGRPANDLFAPDDPHYLRLPQRNQDIERAKALLKAAGKSDLQVELVTAPAQAGLVEASTVLAQQVAKAGIKVKVRKLDLGGYFNGYSKWPFSVEYWDTSPFFYQVALNQLAGATFNTTHFEDATFAKLYGRGVREFNLAKRRQIAHDMQQITWRTGGELVWTFRDIIDGHTSRVKGLKPTKWGLSFNGYGFKSLWLD